MPKVKAVKKGKVKSVAKEAKAPEKEFKLVVKLNDQVFETETNDLEEAIQSFKPDILKTKLVIEVTKGEKTLERTLYLQRGRLLFTNKVTLEALVRNLFF